MGRPNSFIVEGSHKNRGKAHYKNRVKPIESIEGEALHRFFARQQTRVKHQLRRHGENYQARMLELERDMGFEADPFLPERGGRVSPKPSMGHYEGSEGSANR